MSNLVSVLCGQSHPVELSLRPDRSAAALRQRIEQGFVHVRFTGTRGGTELGVKLDRAACDLASADFESGEGSVRLSGHLTLDFVQIQCVADIDLTTLEGTGYLRRLDRTATQSQSASPAAQPS